MRRAIFIIEMLAILVILTAFGLASSRMFVSMGYDVPKIFKTFQANQTRDHFLAMLQKDMDDAQSLPGSCNGLAASASTVLIRSEDGVTKYDLAGRSVKRTVFKVNDCNTPVDSRSWDMPRAVIDLKPLTDDLGSRFAVEVSSYIEQARTGGREKQLRIARIFFIGACPGR